MMRVLTGNNATICHLRYRKCHRRNRDATAGMVWRCDNQPTTKCRRRHSLLTGVNFNVTTITLASSPMFPDEINVLQQHFNQRAK